MATSLHHNTTPSIHAIIDVAMAALVARRNARPGVTKARTSIAGALKGRQKMVVCETKQI